MRRHLNLPGRALTQDQLDRLFTAALEAAIGRVEKDGYFYPLIFELRANGTIQAVAVLETGAVDNSSEPIDRLVALLRSRARESTIIAAAIAILGTGADNVELRLRAANYSADIHVPFSVETTGLVKRKRKLMLGEFDARPAINDIFGTGQ